MGVTAAWRKLHNEGLQNWHPSAIIKEAIILKRIRREERGPRMR